MKGPRVLIVDDCEFVRSVVVLVLQHEGLTTASVSSHVEALEVLESEPYDVVISDYDLGPGYSGLHLLERIAELPLAAPPALILMSGDAIEAIGPTGSIPFLPKPIDVRALRRSVADALAPSRLAG